MCTQMLSSKGSAESAVCELSMAPELIKNCLGLASSLNLI